MRLPDEPRALAAALPDVPRWVETRSLLQSGDGVLTVAERGDGAIVVDTRFPSGSVIGRVDSELLRGVVAGTPRDLELIVQMDGLAEARAVLPEWTVAEVVVHSPARPYQAGGPPPAGVVVSASLDERWLEQLPDEIRQTVALADAAAVRVVDGDVVVAACAAGDVTETLWDVGVDTLDGHRRRGHAAACFGALAAHMAGTGRQPVWAAYADYPPSLGLAAKLGFRPVDRIAVLSRYASGCVTGSTPRLPPLRPRGTCAKMEP